MNNSNHKGGHSIRKARNDGDTVYHHARAVILLGKTGEVTSVVHRPIGYLVNVIAIVGPYCLGGVLIDKVIRAEIGVGRTVPYSRSERRINDDVLHIIQSRKAYPITDQDEERLLPTILEVIQEIIDVETAHRKRLTYFKNKKSDSQVYVNGKWVTVPEHLKRLAFACFAKDMAIRKSGHLKEVVDHTWFKLTRIRFTSYTPKQLKRLKAVQYIASVLYEANYGQYVFNWIRDRIGKLTSKERALFEQIVDVFNLEPQQVKDIEYLALRNFFGEKEEKQILKDFTLQVKISKKRIELRERRYKPIYRHATGCFRVEVMPSPQALESHLENRYR